VVGVLVLIAPAAGALAVALLVGVYAPASGLGLPALGPRLRAAARRPPRPHARRAA
jgi:uncharacterized membrane protein HdeD (DUF308 family)